MESAKWYVLVIFPAEVNRRSMIVGPYLDDDDVRNSLAVADKGGALGVITEGLPCDYLGMQLAVAPGSDGVEIPVIVSPNASTVAVFHHGEQEVV